MTLHYFCLMLAVLIGIVGQLSLKTGSINSIHSNGLATLFEPFIIMGLSCYFVNAVLYIYALKKIPLSVAFPCASLSYVAIAFLSHLLWNEPLGVQHGAALLLIVSGVMLLVTT